MAASVATMEDLLDAVEEVEQKERRVRLHEDETTESAPTESAPTESAPTESAPADSTPTKSALSEEEFEVEVPFSALNFNAFEWLKQVQKCRYMPQDEMMALCNLYVAILLSVWGAERWKISAFISASSQHLQWFRCGRRSQSAATSMANSTISCSS